MIKSIWSIGEDGSGLGWNKWLDEEVYERFLNELNDEEKRIFDEMEYDGYVFVMEEKQIEEDNEKIRKGERMGCLVEWSSVVEECENGKEKQVSYEKLKKYIFEQMKDYLEEEED